MKHLPFAATAALFALAACDTSPTTITSGPADPMKNEIAARGAVELPPAIKSQKTYRCKDNSLAYVDFFDGDKQANVRVGEKNATPTVLVAPEAGQPFVAEGYSLTGNGATVTLATPAAGSQSCKG